MKIQKIVAASMRDALARVRTLLGEDAVILSNRQTADGVEILAIDERNLSAVVTPSEADLEAVRPGATPAYLAASERQFMAPAPAPTALFGEPAPHNRASMSALGLSQPIAVTLSAPTITTSAIRVPGVRVPKQEPAPSESTLLEALHSVESEPAPRVPAGPSMELELLEEIRSLRGMVEQRFSSLAWQDNLKRRPAAVNLMCQLLAAGFSSALARAASNALPENCVGASARSWARRQLASRLECVDGEEVLIARGGVYAFTGPTGVGKTTTVAKIAARCVVKHGAQSLGLITTDSYRIGAQDQLRVFGRILGVPVHTVHDATGLAETLQQLAQKRLILVDTIGMGQRDERVGEQLQMLDGCGVTRVVVLPANAQLETLEDVISIYAGRAEGVKVAGAILSKVDEAVKLGAGLDVLLRHRLPLLFCANGQRVPEDLIAPSRDALIDAALAAASKTTARFGVEEATLFAAWARDEGLTSGVAYA